MDTMSLKIIEVLLKASRCLGILSCPVAAILAYMVVFLVKFWSVFRFFFFFFQAIATLSKKKIQLGVNAFMKIMRGEKKKWLGQDLNPLPLAW